MNRKDRQTIYDKMGGRCAYCGKKILPTKFQVDHLVPKARAYAFKSEAMRQRYSARGDNIDSFENLMPSCRRCNHYKRSHSLEVFRRLMKTIHIRIEKVYIVKVAIDYGVLEIRPFDGVFYFEKVDILLTNLPKGGTYKPC